MGGVVPAQAVEEFGELGGGARGHEEVAAAILVALGVALVRASRTN